MTTPKEFAIDGQPQKKFVLFRRAHGEPFGDPLIECDTFDEVRNYRRRLDWQYCVRVVVVDGKRQYLTLGELEEMVKRGL